MSKVTQWQRNEAARDDLNSNGEAGQGYALQWVGGEWARNVMEWTGEGIASACNGNELFR